MENDKDFTGTLENAPQFIKAEEAVITGSLCENIALMKALFSEVDSMIYREIENGKDSAVKFCLMFNDGVVNTNQIDENIVRPLMIFEGFDKNEQLSSDMLVKRVVQVSGVKKTTDIKEIIEAVSYGDTVLFSEGLNEALLLDTKGFLIRANMEPDGEKVLSGPHEGFTEALLSNLSMVRRKIRSNELKMKFLSLGKQTRTSICVAYMDNIVNKKVLDELYRRLEKINIDSILDANYINELIRDNKHSLFRSIGYSERPDVVTSKLLEGRVAVFVDGTPVVLTVPYLFIENFQSGEDYYLSFYYTSFTRILRMAGLFLSIVVPAFYIAVVAYHHEMLPTSLMTSIAVDSHNVPLPAPVEAFLLLIMFDILRETGIRMPSRIGQAMSIVGALVVGQAAVEAKLVAAPMIIVVAVTGISSLLVPKMNAPTIVLRSFLLILSSCFGLLGLTLGMALVFIHILKLKSFGILQITRDEHFEMQDNKDTFIRAPWWKMFTRPAVMTKNRVRMRTDTGESL